MALHRHRVALVRSQGGPGALRGPKVTLEAGTGSLDRQGLECAFAEGGNAGEGGRVEAEEAGEALGSVRDASGQQRPCRSQGRRS